MIASKTMAQEGREEPQGSADIALAVRCAMTLQGVQKVQQEG